MNIKKTKNLSVLFCLLLVAIITSFAVASPSFEIDTQSEPTVSNVSVTPATQDRGSSVVISAEVEDVSGVSYVQAQIKNAASTVVATISLYDDGAHNDGASGDGVYANSWTIPNSLPVGNYDVFIIASDTFGYIYNQKDASLTVIVCVDGATQSCGSDIGECVVGTQTCAGGVWGACAGETGSIAEICDGLDNDCDSSTDEDLTAPLNSNQTGVCIGSHKTCSGAIGWVDDYSGVVNNEHPVETSCDGLDNNCDGTTDEGCACVDGATQPCGSNVGECQTGTQTCAGGVWGACAGETGPVAEVCDGKDNNCDGSVDEGCACVNGATQSCGSDIGECQTGLQTCASGSWGVCAGEITSVAEICNDSKDNDCDNDTDCADSDCSEDPACGCAPSLTCADYSGQCGSTLSDGCADVLDCSGNCVAPDICCSGTCQTPICSNDSDCDDGDSDTTDTCNNPDTCSATCSNVSVEATITSPEDKKAFNVGDLIVFDSSVVGGTAPYTYSWDSNIDLNIGSSQTFNKNDLSVGDHTIILTVTDSASATDTTSIDVYIPPDSFDWRDVNGQNWMTSVKAQGCGDCWAFSTAGSMEAKYRIEQNNSALSIDLSEQFLDSNCCSSGNCSGGIVGFWCIGNTGIPSESCYGYLGANSGCPAVCNDGSALDLWNITNYSSVSLNKAALQHALIQKGPLFIAVRAQSVWPGFADSGKVDKNGYTIFACEIGPPNHAVVLVGYDNASQSWIIKNSWGVGWGEQGGFGSLDQGTCSLWDGNYAEGISSP